MTSATPERSSKFPRSISPGLPVMPMAVRWAPEGVGAEPQLLDMIADRLDLFRRGLRLHDD